MVDHKKKQVRKTRIFRMDTAIRSHQGQYKSVYNVVNNTANEIDANIQWVTAFRIDIKKS